MQHYLLSAPSPGFRNRNEFKEEKSRVQILELSAYHLNHKKIVGKYRCETYTGPKVNKPHKMGQHYHSGFPASNVTLSSNALTFNSKKNGVPPNKISFNNEL